eukprot:scaffold32510_cov59-Phaeocystis_antarctica.AAC.4
MQKGKSGQMRRYGTCQTLCWPVLDTKVDDVRGRAVGIRCTLDKTLGPRAASPVPRGPGRVQKGAGAGGRATVERRSCRVCSVRSDI